MVRRAAELAILPAWRDDRPALPARVIALLPLRWRTARRSERQKRSQRWLEPCGRVQSVPLEPRAADKHPRSRGINGSLDALKSAVRNHMYTDARSTKIAHVDAV